MGKTAHQLVISCRRRSAPGHPVLSSSCGHAPTRSRGCICVPREQNPGLSTPTSRHRAGSCVLSPGYA